MKSKLFVLMRAASFPPNVQTDPRLRFNARTETFRSVTFANNTFIAVETFVVRKLHFLLLAIVLVLSGMLDSLAQPSTVQFSHTNYVVVENGVTASITVERSGDTNSGFTIDYLTSNGTARASVDYVAQAGTLRFAPGQTNQTFVIQILDDGRVEADETVHLTLSNPSAATILGTGSCSVLTILDNERPGSLDWTFGPQNDVWGYALSALQSDGKILISQLDCAGSGPVYRLNKGGSQDTNFVSATDGCGGTITLVVQSDGKILAACPRSFWQGFIHPPLFIRLNADGSIDGSFNPPSANIQSMALQGDGKVIVVWNFSTSFDGTNYVARLNSDGSLDESFASNISILSVTLQRDGKVLGYGRDRVMRLNSDGSLDSSFAPALGVSSGSIYSVAVQDDGRILVRTDNQENSDRFGMFRLNSDGSLDTTFQLDTRIDRTVYVAPIALQRDGKILIGANLFPWSSANKIVRLNGDGSIDDSFDSGPGVHRNDGGVINQGRVLSILVQSDGQVLFAGEFDSVIGVPRPGIARLNGDGRYIKISPPARLRGNEARLTISTQPGNSYVLQVSSNLVNWVSISTNTAAGYSLEFSDFAAPSFPRRFYQVLLGSP